MIVITIHNLLMQLFGYPKNNAQICCAKLLLMKKIALLLGCLVAGFAAQAQLTLSGTSYNEDFDNVGNGLPTGWEVYTGATATTLGTTATFNTTATAWNQSSAGFKNYASADGLTGVATATDQGNSTDRAIGVRQTGSTGDPGAAFVLHIANTTGLSNLMMTVDLQSLDTTSPRTATWTVDYATGANPSSFTPATATGTLTTGGSTFGGNTITVNFGNALDNQSTDVWIRIVTLTNSTGSGNRPTTGIDDLNLTWNTTGGPNYRPNVVAMTPMDNSMNVTMSSNLTITFDRQVSVGTGGIYLTNESSQNTQTIAANSAMVSVNGNTATISGLTLSQNSMYHVTFDSTAFDTAGYNSYGVYDTTTWNFMTEVGTLATLNEMFDAACATGNLPNGWTKENVQGPAQEWGCSGTTADKYMQMNGFSSGANDNEDWLITPVLDLTGASNPVLNFKGYKGFTGGDISVLYSSDYIGNGDPNNATWTNLNINFSAATSTWDYYSASLPMQNIYIAFKYACSQAANDCAQWRVDSVVTTGTNSILSVKGNNQLPITVFGQSASSRIDVGFTVTKATAVTVSVYDFTGREVYKTTAHAVNGSNRLTLNPGSLSSGIYIVRVSTGDNYGVAKAMVH
jgi:hypothetical protein